MDHLTVRGLFTLFAFCVCCRSAPVENFTENLGELINTDLLNDCNCNWRYLRHYDAKKCQITKLDDCGCPKYFLCSNNILKEETLAVSGCKYENKFYPVGSKIITSDNCQVCRCINEENPKIHCVSKECPVIDVPLQHNCHLLYKKNKCCPIGFKCISDEEKENTTHLCKHNNKFYPFGSKIYPVDDPCLVCDCTEHWNGINNSSCQQHDCMFEKNRHLLDAGCIPVYHESRCCPIEFYCPHNDLGVFSPANDTEDEVSLDFDNQCLFAGQVYKSGMELPINNSCVECKCITPPDFTCIHMACPLPPSAENCYAKRTPGNCCPSYECLYGDESASESNGTICPTPLCADSSCRIEIPSDSECPTCICNSSYSSLEKNELQTVLENFEDMEAKSVDNNNGNKQDFDKEGEKLESSENDVPQFEKMIQEQSIEKSSEVNEITEMEKMFPKEDNFNSESVSDANDVIEQANMQETLNDDEKTEVYLDSQNENGTLETEFQRNMQKRSQGMNQLQQQEPIFNQEEAPFSDIEREDGISQGGDEYDDEIRSFREIKSVPAGCPTPMCENATCRIQIPPGHRCPTCVCKGSRNRQP